MKKVYADKQTNNCDVKQTLEHVINEIDVENMREKDENSVILSWPVREVVGVI